MSVNRRGAIRAAELARARALFLYSLRPHVKCIVVAQRSIAYISASVSYTCTRVCVTRLSMRTSDLFVLNVM